MQVNVGVRRSARGDGVKIFREAGGFNESLSSAGGTSVVIGVLRSCAVERGGNQFRLHNGFMHGAICEVGDLLGVVKPEHAASAVVVAAVPDVVGGRRVTLAQGGGHGRIADGACPSAISH